MEIANVDLTENMNQIQSFMEASFDFSLLKFSSPRNSSVKKPSNYSNQSK